MNHFEPKEAYEFLKKNPDTLFIDCGSEMEYLFVGHPTGAILPRSKFRVPSSGLNLER